MAKSTAQVLSISEVQAPTFKVAADQPKLSLYKDDVTGVIVRLIEPKELVRPKLQWDEDGNPVLAPDGNQAIALDENGDPIWIPNPLTVVMDDGSRFNWHRYLDDDGVIHNWNRLRGFNYGVSGVNDLMEQGLRVRLFIEVDKKTGYRHQRCIPA